MDSPVHREVALSIIALLNNLTFERSALIKDWKDFDDVETKRDVRDDECFFCMSELFQFSEEKLKESCK